MNRRHWLFFNQRVFAPSKKPFHPLSLRGSGPKFAPLACLVRVRLHPQAGRPQTKVCFGRASKRSHPLSAELRSLVVRIYLSRHTSHKEAFLSLRGLPLSIKSTLLRLFQALCTASVKASSLSFHLSFTAYPLRMLSVSLKCLLLWFGRYIPTKPFLVRAP